MHRDVGKRKGAEEQSSWRSELCTNVALAATVFGVLFQLMILTYLAISFLTLFLVGVVGTVCFLSELRLAS